MYSQFTQCQLPKYTFIGTREQYCTFLSANSFHRRELNLCFQVTMDHAFNGKHRISVLLTEDENEQIFQLLRPNGQVCIRRFPCVFNQNYGDYLYRIRNIYGDHYHLLVDSHHCGSNVQYRRTRWCSLDKAICRYFMSGS